VKKEVEEVEEKEEEGVRRSRRRRKTRRKSKRRRRRGGPGGPRGARRRRGRIGGGGRTVRGKAAGCWSCSWQLKHPCTRIRDAVRQTTARSRCWAWKACVWWAFK
jgi:hypothetical protein